MHLNGRLKCPKTHSPWEFVVSLWNISRVAVWKQLHLKSVARYGARVNGKIFVTYRIGSMRTQIHVITPHFGFCIAIPSPKYWGVLCLSTLIFVQLSLRLLWTHSLMELSPSWEAANCAATHELPRILWNRKCHHHVHKSLPLVPILSQIDLVHNIPGCFEL
jgi:hypothetical protein